MLNLMYITNRPEIARIAEAAGVDWIFVDMEFIGKDVRQKGLDTVQNHHTFEDIVNIKKSVHQAKVLVRVNPIHDAMGGYPSSKDEIDATVAAGADIIMLPYFKRVDEVSKFLKYVDGRAETCLLVETPESALQLDKILELDGIDRVHIGLDYFDATINRTGAYVVGSRATLKAFLVAMLEPSGMLEQYEAEGRGFERLALQEELKSMPWGAVWDMYCLRKGVPAGCGYIDGVVKYGMEAASKRK